MPMRLSDCVPLTYVDAVKNPFADQWCAAIESELESLQLDNTWNVLPRSKCHLISTHWVINVKNDGCSEFAKPRLVRERIPRKEWPFERRNLFSCYFF